MVLWPHGQFFSSWFFWDLLTDSSFQVRAPVLVETPPCWSSLWSVLMSLARAERRFMAAKVDDHTDQSVL